MSQKNKQAPANWSAYEQGRNSSFSSSGSIPEDQVLHESNGSPSSLPFSHYFWSTDAARNNDDQTLRERRSSQRRLSASNPNNLGSFARSFQRAAGFREITPVRRGSISFGGTDDPEGRGDEEGVVPTPHRSLLRQQLEAAQSEQQEEAIVDSPRPSTQVPPDMSDTTPLLTVPTHKTLKSLSSRTHLGSDSFPALGTSYGSISSRLTATAQRRASVLIQQQLEASARARGDQDEIKDDVSEREIEVETTEDGEVIERLVGESTVPMAIFNSTNVLIGVGILALPLAVKYSGWVIGLIFLTLAALATNYTAKLLAKCLDTNTGATTYGDIAYLAFGTWGRACVESLFVLELTAANVALVILFADSMHSIIPSISVVLWKAVITFGLLPLNFAAFKTLSVTSVLGIVCCFGIIIMVIVDGCIKPHAPGSLREVSKTYAFPADWRTLPLSVGLFMAPWGGHSVFPAVYRDMRHPKKYHKALRVTYSFTYGLDLTMAVLGYLMFGEQVRDEITANILESKSYPRALAIIIIVLIAVIPITKIPLSNRPIQDTLNKKLMIDLRQMDPKARQYSQQSWKHRLGRFSVGASVNIAELAVAILFPSFDSIMALMGSALCLTICTILPVAFYLQIFSKEGNGISKKERYFGYFLITICAILAVIGTVFAIVPKEKIGAQACRPGSIACLS